MCTAAERAWSTLCRLCHSILGDDVLITDELVASEYENLLGRLGVSISRTKSLISHKKGAGEFAKRFRVKNLMKDISPISVRSLKNFFHPYGLIALGRKSNI